jgi:hypothetical protein
VLCTQLRCVGSVFRLQVLLRLKKVCQVNAQAPVLHQCRQSVSRLHTEGASTDTSDLTAACTNSTLHQQTKMHLQECVWMRAKTDNVSRCACLATRLRGITCTSHDGGRGRPAQEQRQSAHLPARPAAWAGRGPGAAPPLPPVHASQYNKVATPPSTSIANHGLR